MNLTEVINAVKDIDSLDDLKNIDSVLRTRYSQLQKDLQGQFDVGDTVTLQHRGQTLTGEVIKLLVKNITVKTDIGTFRCSPSLLTKVEDSEMTTV